MVLCVQYVQFANVCRQLKGLREHIIEGLLPTSLALDVTIIVSFTTYYNIFCCILYELRGPSYMIQISNVCLNYTHNYLSPLFSYMY